MPGRVYWLRQELDEVPRVFTKCLHCEQPQTAEYFRKGVSAGEGDVCSSRDVCVMQCRDEEPGRVYSGMCGSQMRFSRIDFKKPADITTFADDAIISRIAIDNTCQPTYLDLLIYSNFSSVIATAPTSGNRDGSNPSNGTGTTVTTTPGAEDFNSRAPFKK